jgi:hypothetical protein
MASNNTGNLPHQRGDRLTYRDRNWSETTGRDNQIPAKRVSTIVDNRSHQTAKAPNNQGLSCNAQDRSIGPADFCAQLVVAIAGLMRTSSPCRRRMTGRFKYD